MWVIQLITIIVLIVLSIEDICYKKIHVLIPLFGCVVIILVRVMENELCIIEMMCSILPGLLLTGIAYVTKEAIGIGDGIVMCMTGLSFDILICTLMILISFGMAAVFCLAGIVFGRVGRKTEVAFLPFILSGYITVLLI